MITSNYMSHVKNTVLWPDVNYGRCYSSAQM